MIALYLILSVVIAFLFYRKTLPVISKGRRYLLFALRALFIFSLFLLLFNPILYFEHNYTERPILLILTDKSNSMKQRIAGKTKTEHLTPYERKIEALYEDKGYSKERVALFTSNPSQSLLLDDIKDILHSGKDIKAIAIASDGWFQDNPTLFKQLTNTPIFTFLPPNTFQEQELRINNITYNKNARKGEAQNIGVNITAKNIEGNIEAVLKKTNQGGKPTILQRRSISNQSETTSTQIDFRVNHTELGLQVYEIEVASPDSLTATGYAAVQVLDNKAKILLLSDGINWDVRLFNRFLNFSERFDIDFVYSFKNGFWQGGVKKELHWQDYAGFIIINHSNMRLPDAEVVALKNKLLLGSGLIYIGNVNAQMAEILPARATNIRVVGQEQVKLRQEALQYQIFREIENNWAKFPPVDYYFLEPKEESTLLAEVQLNRATQNQQVILLGSFGSGNVLQIAFSGLWRWQFTTTEEVMGNFINGLAQFIFSNANNNFFSYTNKNIYYSGENITVHLAAFDEKLNPLTNINARLRLLQENKEVFTDFMAREGDEFALTVPQMPAGQYRYHIIDDISNNETSGEFEVLQQDIESFNKGFNTGLLQDLSISSQGMVIYDIDMADLDIAEAVSVKKVRHIELPLHKNVWFIVLLLAVFCAELYLRKKWSLY